MEKGVHVKGKKMLMILFVGLFLVSFGSATVRVYTPQEYFGMYCRNQANGWPNKVSEVNSCGVANRNFDDDWSKLQNVCDNDLDYTTYDNIPVPEEYRCGVGVVVNSNSIPDDAIISKVEVKGDGIIMVVEMIMQLFMGV